MPAPRRVAVFGRNEQGGLRCVYHGWKFATDGTCLDMPNEPAESDFLIKDAFSEYGLSSPDTSVLGKHKVEAVAYPTRERGGLLWAYLGPRGDPPPMPDLEVLDEPDAAANILAVIRTRRRLLEAARALRSGGTIPAGVDDPSVYAVRTGGVELPRTANWLSATEHLRRAHVDHPGLDRTAMGGRII